MLFWETLQNWADWGRVFADRAAFAPLVREIFRRNGLPMGEVRALPPGTNAVFRVGGRLYMVTKRRDWYENRLRATFGGVRVTEAGGYFVFVAEKRGDRPPTKQKPAPQLSKKLARKYAKAGK